MESRSNFGHHKKFDQPTVSAYITARGIELHQACLCKDRITRFLQHIVHVSVTMRHSYVILRLTRTRCFLNKIISRLHQRVSTQALEGIALV